MIPIQRKSLKGEFNFTASLTSDLSTSSLHPEKNKINRAVKRQGLDIFKVFLLVRAGRTIKIGPANIWNLS
jgi:hypothetical protein